MITKLNFTDRTIKSYAIRKLTPRSSRPQLSVISTEAQSHRWGGKLVNALTAASGGICVFVEL